MPAASPSLRFALYSKHLQSLPLPRAASLIRELGFDGVDLTVRPGGFVDPARVAADLPVAARIVRDAGLEIPVLSTAITRADDPVAAPTFYAAAECGIPNLKLGYVRYDAFGSFRALMYQAARELDGLQLLAQKTGVGAVLHTHSEAHLTASPPVVWWLLKGRNPHLVAAYVDPGHMCVEGAGDGWRIGLDLLSSHLALVAVKDFTWETVPDLNLGKNRFVSRIVPLDQGIVPWQRVLDCLRSLNYSGYFVLHSEYQGFRSWRDLSLEELLAQTSADLTYLHSLLGLPHAAVSPG